MNVVAMQSAKPARKPKRRKSKLAKVARASVEKYVMAGATVGLLGVSLWHLVDGVVTLTQCEQWQGWAMAIGIDVMFIATELGLLKQGQDRWGQALVSMTLIVSAYLNALAFSHGHLDAAHIPAIGFGLFIPAALYMATHRLAKLK